MADVNLKAETADNDGPSADTEMLFGAADQSSATPKPYTFAGIKTWIKSWGDTYYLLASALIAPRHTGYVAGRWYRTPEAVSAVGSAQTANTIHFYPFIPAQTITVSDLGARVGTAQATKNAQFAIYAGNTATCRPTGSALSSTPSVSLGSATDISGTLGANVQLTKGTLYWLATNVDSATAVLAAVGAASTWIGGIIGSTSLSDMWNAGQAGGIQGVTTTTSATFNTWPDVTSATFVVVSNNVIIPCLAFKVASVP